MFLEELLDTLLGTSQQTATQWLAAELELAPPTKRFHVAGCYMDHDVDITLRSHGGRHVNTFDVTYQFVVALPPEIAITIQELHPLRRIFQRHTPVSQQMGRSMVTDRFHIATIPPSLKEELLGSLDFCYGLQFFPLPMCQIQSQLLLCKPPRWFRGTQIHEIPSIVKKIGQFVTTLELVIAKAWPIVQE